MNSASWCHALRIASKSLGQNFNRYIANRYIALQLGVARAINFAHAARTDRCETFERAESVADRRRHIKNAASLHDQEALRPDPLPLLVVNGNLGICPASIKRATASTQRWLLPIAHVTILLPLVLCQDRIVIFFLSSAGFFEDRGDDDR